MLFIDCFIHLKGATNNNLAALPIFRIQSLNFGMTSQSRQNGCPYNILKFKPQHCKDQEAKTKWLLYDFEFRVWRWPVTENNKAGLPKSFNANLEIMKFKYCHGLMVHNHMTYELRNLLIQLTLYNNPFLWLIIWLHLSESQCFITNSNI